MVTAALRWLFTSSLSRFGILFLSVLALTKVPAFVFLLHHISLFALICAYIAGRFVYYAIVIQYPSQRYPPSCFKFYFCHLPWVLSCSSSLSCHLSATNPETDHPAMYSTGRCVCFCFCFLPSIPVFLCLFGLMYVFAFHLISFVALHVRIGSFGNSVLPFIIIIAFEGVNHIGEHIRDWFTGATLFIHHVVYYLYYHSIGTWGFHFQEALTVDLSIRLNTLAH